MFIHIYELYLSFINCNVCCVLSFVLSFNILYVYVVYLSHNIVLVSVLFVVLSFTIFYVYIVYLSHCIVLLAFTYMLSFHMKLLF